MANNILIIFLTGLGLSFVLVLVLRYFSQRYSFLQFKEIPLVGGLAIGIGFLAASFTGAYIFKDISQESVSIICASLIMLIFGALDDWRELSVIRKLTVQIIGVSFLIFSGVRTHIAGIPEVANLFITLIWVIGIANAFNLLDVADGIASLSALIIGLTFCILSYWTHNMGSLILSLALVGSNAGFLAFNLPRAKIYMGNSGSHLLGFVLASIAIVISYAPLEKRVALLSPVLILGLPLFDTSFLIFMRLKNRRAIFRKSQDHIAIRLIQGGYSSRKTLLIMGVLAVFYSLSGLLVSQLANIYGMVIILTVISASIFLMNKVLKISQ